MINYSQTSAGNAFMEYVRTAFIFRQFVGGYEAEIGKEINILRYLRNDITTELGNSFLFYCVCKKRSNLAETLKTSR